MRGGAGVPVRSVGRSSAQLPDGPFSQPGGDYAGTFRTITPGLYTGLGTGRPACSGVAYSGLMLASYDGPGAHGNVNRRPTVTALLLYYPSRLFALRPFFEPNSAGWVETYSYVAPGVDHPVGEVRPRQTRKRLEGLELYAGLCQRITTRCYLVDEWPRGDSMRSSFCRYNPFDLFGWSLSVVPSGVVSASGMLTCGSFRRY